MIKKIKSHFLECELKERLVCASLWIVVLSLLGYCFFVVMHYVFSTFLLYMDVYGIPVDHTAGDIWRRLMW